MPYVTSASAAGDYTMPSRVSWAMRQTRDLKSQTLHPLIAGRIPLCAHEALGNLRSVGSLGLGDTSTKLIETESQA